MLTDTHCHLFYKDIKNNLTDIIHRANSLGVDRFICVATNLSDGEECIELSKTYSNIFASIGIHPHDANYDDTTAVMISAPCHSRTTWEERLCYPHDAYHNSW